MGFFFLISVFLLYSGLKLSIEHNRFCKNLFLKACSGWDARFSSPEWDQSLNLVEPLIMGTRTWSSYFVIPKYLDYA